MATAVTSTLKMPVLAALTFLLLAVACRASPYYPLELGYYRYKCPQAEAIVKAVMEKAIFQNPGNGAAVIRMLFHDCFVEVLLESASAISWCKLRMDYLNCIGSRT